jgi:DNA-binding NtrC family response regulator
MEAPRIKVLAVDDQQEALFALEALLTEQGFDVVTAGSGKETLAQVERENPDLILLDVMMPDMNGYEVTRVLKGNPKHRFTPIVLLTANDTLEDLLRGLNEGADDYIRKPYRKEELLARMNAVMRTRRLYTELKHSTDENLALRKQVSDRYGFDNLIGRSPAMQEVYELMVRVKDAAVPVLITGESGTGKELVARAIHVNSPRKDKPFVAQNCSAFNDNLLESELFGHVRGAFTGAVRDKPGLFESANGGSFFLDELGEMSPALQVKLLRVLQEGTFFPVGSTTPKKVDVRVIAATHRNLQEMMARGAFREDLYYRLNVVNIKLPPLRDRRADIADLTRHFLSEKARKNGVQPKTLDPEALKKLTEYHWPGNIRELENEIERLMLMSGDAPQIDVALVSAHIGGNGSGGGVPAPGEGGKLKDALEDLERRMIAAALQKTEGNKSEAARELGVSRSNLIAKAKLYGIE